MDEKTLYCPSCGSTALVMEDYDANGGGCGDPDCCGGSYWMKEVLCTQCQHWERLIEDNLYEEWSKPPEKTV